jgi:hypothetical protein
MAASFESLFFASFPAQCNETEREKERRRSSRSGVCCRREDGRETRGGEREKNGGT